MFGAFYYGQTYPAGATSGAGPLLTTGPPAGVTGLVNPK